jgi:hypothetical protein
LARSESGNGDERAPRIPTDKIPESKPHIEAGLHLKLYRFPQPAVFAPDYAPEEIEEIAMKLRKEAGLSEKPSGVVARS